MAKQDITHKAKRGKLPPRNAPYWHAISNGAAIGYRRAPSGPEADTWSVRIVVNGKYQFKKLGGQELSFNEAKELADEQIRGTKVTGNIRNETVREACEVYVRDQRPAAAISAEAYFKRTLWDHPLADIPLNELHPLQIKQWQESLLTDTRGVDHANRIITVLRAALNLAYRERRVASNSAWDGIQKLQPHQDKRKANANRPAEYLNREECLEYINACPADLATLARGVLYTAARPRELYNAKRKDLNLDTHTLSLTSLKNNKGVSTPFTAIYFTEAYSFFEELAKVCNPPTWHLAVNTPFPSYHRETQF